MSTITTEQLDSLELWANAQRETLSHGVGRLVHALVQEVRAQRLQSTSSKQATLREMIQSKDEQWEALMAEVCRRYSVKREEIEGRDRYPRIARPRMLLMSAAVELGWQLTEVARLLGVHHSTVVHARKTVDGREALELAVRVSTGVRWPLLAGVAS